MNKITKISMFLSLLAIITILTITITQSGYNVYNNIGEKNTVMLTEVEPFDIEYIYNPNKPSTAEKTVIVEGINGLDFTYDGLEYVHLSDKKNAIVEVGSGLAGVYKGRLTGYGPDCEGCSKLGNVSCLTKEGKNHSLTTDGIYYNDETYGKIRILAADNSVFPCGTIVKVNNGILKEFYGIVLDTGYTMRKAYSEGVIWMDLAFDSQKTAKTSGATSSNTSFNVQRWGW